jgi:hypothetical protein
MTRRPVLVLLATFLALVAAFFVFYEARLLFVTRGLRSIRPGGSGAYFGAVTFPLIALVFAWGARRSWRSSQSEVKDQRHEKKL